MTKEDPQKHAKTSDGKAWPCPTCKEPKEYYTKGETYDGAYDTYSYHCHACGKQWRVVETD